MDNEAGHLGEGLVYDDIVPIECVSVNESLSSGELLKLNDENEKVLQFIAAVEEHHTENEEDFHAGKETAHDIARLEYKINLLLDMVGDILIRQQSLPDARPIRMTASTLQWEASPDYSGVAGDTVICSLYLSKKYVHPLRLVGTVRESRQGRDDTLVIMEYSGILQSVQQLLEKLIFRHHRRMVALSRHI